MRIAITKPLASVARIHTVEKLIKAEEERYDQAD
jgi:hypothetical protein